MLIAPTSWLLYQAADALGVTATPTITLTAVAAIGTVAGTTAILQVAD